MRRLHLFEVMDLSACPAWLRRMETETLQAAEALFDTTSPLVARVAAVLDQLRPALVPAVVWAITPTLRPFSLRRLAATYAVPVVPAVTAWDGLISTLRTYTPAELQGFVDRLDAPGWTWDIGTAVHRRVPISWILGTPP